MNRIARPIFTRALGTLLLASTFVFGCAAPSEEDVGAGEGAATESRAEEKVLITFAGFERGRVVDLASRLSTGGWNVIDGERGGERMESIQGMNEIRFFHPSDAERAATLAKDAALLAPEGGLVVRDFSQSREGRANRGHLEIWISTHEKVFIAFAGGLERDRVIGLASRLSASGWNVVDAERGGERVESLPGMNEVRFFHPNDAPRAAALAAAVAHGVPRQSLEVRDLSRSSSRKDDPGQLEVWISE